MNSTDKKELLQKLLAKKKSENVVNESERITHSDKTKFPLSMVQRGIWMDQVIDPDSFVYNIPFACKIRGVVNIDALREGIRRIIERHDAWRTVIRSGNDEVYQQVLPEVNLDFRWFDCRGQGYNDDKVAYEAKKFVAERIDLENGPLVRFALYQTEDDLFYFILSGHHIVYDGTSKNLFCRELSAEYYAVMNNQESTVVKPTVSYGDYAEYNLSKMSSKEIQSQIEYWKDELVGIEPTEFPSDCIRPAVRVNKGGIVYFDIPQGIEAKIREYAVSHQVTVNVVLLAALNVLLEKYTRNDSIAVEITVANRDNEQIERLLGCFINNLIIVTEMNPDMTFDEVVAATKARMYSSLENKDVPLETLVKEVNPPRDLSRTPFTEVGFNYNPRKRIELAFEGCELEEFGLGDFVVLTDVNFQIFDDNETLSGFVEYNSSLYEKETINTILSRYMILLDNLTELPKNKLSGIEAAGKEEKDKILNSFNATKAEYPQDKTIVDLFEEQVNKTPNNIAVVFEDESLTYAELNAKANMLGGKLRALGVKPNDMVGMLTERSLEMIIGIFGILKAGGAYVPMDPTYPEDRIRYMLEDSAPKAVLTYKASVNTDIPVIDLADAEAYADVSENLEKVNTPDDLIYCIYTSGTTGKPKGVLIEHSGVNNLANFYIREHNVGTTDKFLMFASYCFDASTTEIMTTLLSGAQLHVASSDLRGDAIRLEKYISERGITIALLPPALLEQLEVRGPRVIITAGSESSRRIIESNKHIPVYSNDYGPTEGSVCATVWKYISGDELPQRIPIGKPISNKEVYIVSGDTLCGIGVPGELCIAGVGIARGYLNRPELTSEKFVSNPFGEGRMYHTGDLARWLPDGNIEYLGRIDEQVKIRGFRVELGEIENRIREIENIKDCAVIARADASGNKAVYAYMVMDTELDSSVIRDELSTNLPDYMIPSYMMRIDAIPMTRNGKLDKRALPEIEIQTGTEYVAPRSKEEEALCEAFKAMLGVEKVGIKDSFFELGGDSIKAIRVVSNLRAKGYSVTVKDILNRRTPESIALYVVQTAEEAYEQGEVTGTVILTPIMSQFEKWNLAKPEHFNQSEMIRIEAETDVVRKALEELVRHHDVLRAVYRNKSLEILSYEQSKKFQLTEYDVREHQSVEDEVDKICTEIQAGINLAEGPLMKAAIFNTDFGKFLFICIHHYAVDGVSWRILLEDFESLVESYKNNQVAKLPTKTASFIEWSRALEEYRTSDELREERAFWDTFEKHKEESRLVISEEVLTEQINQSTEFELSESVTEQLLRRSGKAYNTRINDLLLAALGMSVKELTGQDFVSVAVEGHGRESINKPINIDRTVGWFTSEYPVVVKCTTDIENAIVETKDMLHEVPNNGFGYGLLYDTDLNASVDICFNYLGEMDSEGEDSDNKIKLPQGLNIAEENRIGGFFNINAWVRDKKFICLVSYNNCTDEYASRITALLKNSIERIVAWCVSHESEIHVTESDMYNLTPLQEGMYFHNEMDHEDSSYRLQTIYKSNIRIDMDCMRVALDTLAEKYEVLKTAFAETKSGRVKQYIAENRKLELVKTEHREKLDETTVKAFAAEDLKRGFNLKEDSLMRVAVLSFADCDVMLFSSHHLIVDGWCISLINGDLNRFYNLCLSGTAADTLKALAQDEKKYVLPFKDYAEWIQRIKKADIEKYWNEYLEEYDGVAELTPFEKVTEESEEAVKEEVLLIDENTTESLNNLAKRCDATISTVTQLAIGLLLQKHCGTDDVLLGNVVSGRNVPLKGVENAVGMFINTVPLRIKAEDANVTIEGLLRSLQKSNNESNGYDHAALNEIKVGNRGVSDYIKHLFVFENYPGTASESEDTNEGLVLETIYAREQTNYGIDFAAFYIGSSLAVRISYDSAKYTAGDIKLYGHHLENIVQQIAATPSKRVSEVTVFDELERETILTAFNDTDAEFSREKTVRDLFEEQVERTPNNVAVVFGDESITYEELNTKANQVARILQSYGVQRGDYVAMYIEKSIEMIVGIYGIIKCGAVYVPINTMYPEDRVEYILNDCKADVLLCGDTELGIEFGGTRINLKHDIPNEAESEYVKSNINPEDGLYVIYTSGTTGKPKGVEIMHKNVVRLMFNDAFEYDFNENDVWTMFHSYGFDFSVWEMYGATLYGGKLVVVSEEEAQDANLFLKLLRRHKVTVLNQVPTAFYNLDREDNGEELSVRYLIFGGEALNPTKLRKWKNNHPNTEIVNMYGITETTVHVTYRKIEEAEIQRGISDIGRAIPTLKVYIMQGDTLCGIGVPGELCVTGDGVARGYLDRPELTAQKFVKNPFGEGRMYRSGDLARWLPDGNLEYLGRIDEQVKIRGFRVELGEIESRIREIKGVTDCAVIARADASGEKAVYAYIVSDTEIMSSVIRDELSKNLPDYMIPSYMMRIESIPVTRNGKLDRRALPEIEAKSGSEYVAPRNETEKLICAIFEEILSVEQVSVKDSFFALGGHSLRATRLVNRIEAETGTRIALKNVFGSPTPEKLAEFVTGTPAEEYVSIPKAEEKEYYPMSSAQKRTYLICQMDPNGVLYNMPINMRITGEVNPEALKNALQELINRHEILRTQFLMVDGEPVQKVLEYAEADFEYVTDTKTSEEDLIADFVRPFDLSRVPLVRVRLVNRGDHHLLNIEMHHIVGDGMSMGTFTKELTALYNGEALEPLTHQFKDYSEWMRTRDLSSQAEYWKSQFEDDIPVLDMPLDFTRPQEQSYSGAMVFRSTGIELAERIKKLASQTGTTEFMVFMSAAMVLLGKYSRQEDIVIGTPISGRTHKDTESMLGMFVNTLAMRGKPEGKKTYLEFLNEIKETSLKAYENQEYPFEELVEAVEVQRDISRNPLFDVMLVLQNNEEVELKLNKAKSEWAGLKDTVAKFDLTFNVGEYDGDFSLALEYCTALFTEESAEGILEHLIAVLDSLTETPEVKIADIEAVGEDEKEKILTAFNDTKAEYSKDKTIVELFEEQVERTPNNIAVTFENESLTYAELNAKANMLGGKLRALGVKPNDMVGMLTERSLEMIIGIFGILKAGGAYVPMDPTYPEDRIRFMLEDAAPKAVLIYNASVITDIPVIDLADAKAYADVSENLVKVNTPNDLIYCIYTSGTTGKPKGVLIEHRSAYNLASYMRSELDIADTDRVMLFANYIFDGSVWEILSALMNGASLNIPTDETIHDIEAMKKFVAERNINVSYFPPQYYEQGKFALDKYVITAGSSASMHVVETILEHGGYINSYGPTEATVCISNWICRKNEKPERIIIGKPISNVQVYIVQGNTLCGVGMPGELCVSGDGVARGYLNRPELTSEKFAQNPFGEGRMYHTGDLARWLPDGNIEYLGRIDEQVKIRGFRVELGEIESRIHEIENVKDCAVIARADASGDKAIYAYVVSDTEISASEIRDELSKNLPDYMIPSYLMRIDAIPMTRNGKVDKRALPDIEAKSGSEYVAPRNETEKLICAIFEEILSVEQVSVKDSFFALGGHSLRATRLVNRIEAETGTRIALKNVFGSPTPEKLAEFITGTSAEEYVSIPKAEVKEYYPMSSAQKRTYFICQLDLDGISYNMPQSMRLTGEVYPETLKRALQQLLDRHEILRTQFLMVDGEPVQKVLEHVEADFEYVTDTETPEGDLIAGFVRPFDLNKAPLVRTRLIDRGDCHLLCIDMHHIVGDGMSMGTFTRELNALYNGEALEPLTHQFKDYSEWMRTRDLSSQEKYWKSQFEEDIPVLEMPLDFTRPQEQSYSGSLLFRSTGKVLGERIKKLASQTGTTEFMVLLSAAMVLLGKYSRQEDIVIGTPISGRTHKDTEGMLGMFINTLALRGKPEGKMSYLEFLNEIKETCLKAYENQEYPFEELVEAVDVQRDMSRNPLFDVMLSLQNNENVELNLGETESEWVVTADTVAKFDFTIDISENDGDFGICLEYCTALFTEESAMRILEHYIVVLDRLTNTPEAKLAAIEAVSREEKEKILNSFNATKAEYPKDKTIVELFEEQVERTPNNIAVTFENESLTYAELNAKANMLGGKLRALGVKPNDMVGMLTERSLEMIIGIFGVLKAGGAYVPMDPTYPEDRISFMLEDAAPKAVLTYNASVNTDLPIIDLADTSVYEGRPENLEKINVPENLINCIYTSGTTGKPKGVVVENRSVVNTCIWYSNTYGVQDNIRILQMTNYTFDPFEEQVFGALIKGGTVCLIDDESRYDARAIYEYIVTQQIAIADLPHSLANQLLDYEYVSTLKYLILGGEQLNRMLVNKALAKGYRVSNHYGPTETTIDALTFECAEIDRENVPIGIPIDNVQVYIVQEDVLCGIGIPGELCIAGDGLARGYLNRPELTAEKFVRNPFGEGRMYHTGDLARWLPDGNIEYLGRIDEQVKIRGFRVELGEIESRIRELENVKDCAVIARADTSGEKAIYAYVVGDTEISASEIRNELLKNLPDYMVPSYIMRIEAIPMTGNGKLDKKALPNIEAKSGNEYIAPRNEIETLICSVFGESLNVEKVGINDDFFELGGNSLKAIRVVSKLKLAGVDISIKDLYTLKTVAQITSGIGEKNGKVTGLDSNSKKISVVVLEMPEAIDKNNISEDIIRVMEDYSNNLTAKSVVKRYTPNYMQQYYLHGSEESHLTGMAVRVSGASLEELRIGLRKLVCVQGALRTCYSEETGEITEYEYGDWEIPYITASQAADRSVLLNSVWGREIESGKEYLPVLLIVETSSNDYEVFLSINHCLWDRISCDAFSDTLETLLNGAEVLSPDSTYSDYVTMRETSKQSVYSDETEKYLIDTVDDYLKRSTEGNYETKSFVLNLNRDRNVNYDINWLMSKYVEIGENEEEPEIPFFTLYHCRDDRSMNTVGYYIDYVLSLYEQEGNMIRFYDETIEKLKQGSENYQFLCDKYQTRICGNVVMLNLYESNESWSTENVNQIHMTAEREQQTQKRIMCTLNDNTVSVEMVFHTSGISDEEFLMRIKKAFISE